MSSKSGNSPTVTSITARLTLLYLVSTLIILLCTGGFLFVNLIDDLEFEDNDFLVERINSLRSVIARHPGNSAEALEDHLHTDRTNQQVRYMARIEDSRGRVVLETPGMAAVRSQQFPPPVTASYSIGKGIRHQGGDGRYYLMNAAWAEANGDSHFRLVQVALDVTDEVQLMEKYRLKMGISLVVGLCLAGGLSIVITRRGLRPLQQMTSAVTRITAVDLHQRVRSGRWPKELDQLTVALDEMLERLENAFNRLTEFSANLAHELRTPLNNLRGEAEVALSRPRTADDYRKIIESSTEEFERLSRMISDILFLARPEQGIDPRPIDAAAETGALVDYYLALAEERRIALSLHGSGTVVADPRLFQRAVGNLIANAIYYTPAEGHVTVTITTCSDGGLTITIRDSGTGIPPEELPRVFDRFHRGPRARQQHAQGSGLGLAIVRSIMDLHGGDVTLASEEGSGTTAALHFPSR